MPACRPVHRASLLLYIGAVVHVCRGLTALAVLAFVARAAWSRDGFWLGAAAIALVVWAIFALIHAFEGARCNCAVCRGRLFIGTRNSKHPSARRALGSFTLHTALEVLFTVRYRCQHCGSKVNCRAEADPAVAADPPKRPTRTRRARIPPPVHASGQNAILLHTRTDGLIKKTRNR